MELQNLVNRYTGYFIVNYNNFEVVYSDGYENENGLWCYKVSDLEKMPEKPRLEEVIPVQSSEQSERDVQEQGNTPESSAENTQDNNAQAE